MKENDILKKEGKKNNYNIIIIAIVAVILLVLVALIVKGCGNKKENEEKKQDNKPNETVIEKKGSSEEEIKSAYGMSKDDAINIVKEIYNDDVHEYSCEINVDSKYIVSVKNTITNETVKYLVDPESIDNSFYEINE